MVNPLQFNVTSHSAFQRPMIVIRIARPWPPHLEASVCDEHIATMLDWRLRMFQPLRNSYLGRNAFDLVDVGSVCIGATTQTTKTFPGQLVESLGLHKPLVKSQYGVSLRNIMLDQHGPKLSWTRNVVFSTGVKIQNFGVLNSRPMP